MRTVAVATLGCKVNRYDTEHLLDLFELAGFRQVRFGEEADAYLINTCTVTQKADRQGRQLVARARRASPDAVLIVTGCYVDRDHQAFLELEGVDYILGNACKDDLDSLLRNGLERHSPPRVLMRDIAGQRDIGAVGITRFRGRSRPLVKIQDGCDAGCAYCIVPSVRGPGRSVPPDRVMEEVRTLAKAGYLEVVLSGIHLGAYGRDLGDGSSLARLLSMIVREVPVPRIRLSSIEPLEIDEELISLMEAEGPVCPHLHIPLQSGNEEVLRRMNRDYTPAQYSLLIEDLAARIPDLCLGADVMAGFPGETDAQFRNTIELIRNLPISYLHVFPYSSREGTAAYRFGDRLSPETVHDRAWELRDLGTSKRSAFYERHMGRVMDVVPEGRGEDPAFGLRGLTRNYIPVSCPDGRKIGPGLVEVVITEVEGMKVWGVPYALQRE